LRTNNVQGAHGVAVNLVVLIPESTRKDPGGDASRLPVDSFNAALPEAPQSRLASLREELRSKAPPNSVRAAGLVPAYVRFQGNMYRAIPPEAWERRRPEVEVLIASGLYGMVASRDTILAYSLSMAEPVATFGKLNRWWRDGGLPDILAAYLRAVRPTTVVDLLSREYREAVEGYDRELSGTSVKAIDFPGMGRASQPRRGEIVAKILRTGKV